ncbi:stage II sporulation protein D [Paenibacillus sp. HJGM_3]|uniref:stage II sporulation protein D n=1 Tax=Paenibacillus sp. HJGM_3 TaxID=3379816 RepID=UPI00385DD398
MPIAKLVARFQRSAAPYILLAVAAFLLVAILIPALLVDRTPTTPIGHPNGAVSGSGDQAVPNTKVQGPVIPVYRTGAGQIEQVPLEVYVRNVVASEMPADFELEALKAQALAARTYIVKRLLEHDYSEVPVAGALVTDTVAHQAYKSEDELRRTWGEADYPAKIAKLNRAVNETSNQVILYKGEPILAAFFSTSNGYTENSEDYWTTYIPYLRSVPSPWDQQLSPKFEQTVSLKAQDVMKTLGLPAAVPATTGNAGMRVMATSAGHRIKKLQIGGKSFTGREVREKLGLASSQFLWKVKGTDIEITTFGYGHGVGMSQWGANGMAKAGYDAAAIVKHYYQGVELGQASSILPK